MTNAMGRAAVILTALVTTFAGATAACADPLPQRQDDPAAVLVFSKTAGFRHDSIPTGIQAIRDLGAANNFTVEATEDAGAFTPANLDRFDTVVFLSTTGDVLNATQQAAFEAFIGSGKGYVGIHAAADTEYDWPFYGNLVGAYFQRHPAIQPARVVVEDRAHPATAHLGPQWTRTDEWYSFRANPRANVHVLASLDESSYSGGGMGDHPIMWCQNIAGGRSFYTGFGHTNESYADPALRQVLLGGIQWAAGSKQADCRPENGYTALYDGSTTGWSQAGPGGFSNADNTLTSFGGMGMLWYDARQFSSYSLKADWRLAGDDNSGIFVGFPPSDDPWSAVNNGYEIQIDATDAPDRTTGAVYSFKGPDTAARDAALNPPGQWNTFELLVEGERLQVFLNGIRINDFTNTDPARGLAGHIGIQNHGDGDEVAFRDIRIKELTPPQTGGPILGVGGRCLDGTDTAVQLWSCNANTSQRWSAQGQTLRVDGKCLAAPVTANGARVTLAACDDNGPQHWVRQADGTLKNPASGRCLSVLPGTTRNGTPVRILDCTAGPHQLWTSPTV
ncbi:glycosyl hydrolase [Virgisporangium aliadipatigenens]|uniref:Glycosyl hydrolase n=1 Tax=Virgisporangium aliadipatigenens TaxID=741659 RepID=A0A8J3YGX4_9ACTN|nr:ThuA domain-containing protein [Virgisporangium aliadipatigenens]GIJ45059.1 glycosyl hydrolase [Virgisporangium aliadipatigenens]